MVSVLPHFEPVVGDQSPGENNTHPEYDREHTGQFRSEWQRWPPLPLIDGQVGAVVKRQCVHRSQEHYHHLHQEEDVGREARRLAVDQGQARDRADNHAGHLPRKEALLQLPKRSPPVADPDQPEIHHEHQPGKEAHGDHVHAEQGRIAV